mmetsp:Transcript_34418/g.98777  ORF Transcript_34418/g.98777 Transcript_34418/m.98777 type:complete len:271 (-) Transcript_34418:45-857(-)
MPHGPTGDEPLVDGPSQLLRVHGQHRRDRAQQRGAGDRAGLGSEEVEPAQGIVGQPRQQRRLRRRAPALRATLQAARGRGRGLVTAGTARAEEMRAHRPPGVVDKGHRHAAAQRLKADGALRAAGAAAAERRWVVVEVVAAAEPHQASIEQDVEVMPTLLHLDDCVGERVVVAPARHPHVLLLQNLLRDAQPMARLCAFHGLEQEVLPVDPLEHPRGEQRQLRRETVVEQALCQLVGDGQTPLQRGGHQVCVPTSMRASPGLRPRPAIAR